MKLLTRFREEFSPQTTIHAEIKRSPTKTKAKTNHTLARLPRDNSAIIPSMKISLR